MIKYLLNKFKHLIITLFVLTFTVFTVSHLAPGDPLRAYFGDISERLSHQQRETAIEELGLDEPLLIQYKNWVKNALQGDLGESYKYKMPVSEVIEGVYVNTIILTGSSFIIIFLGALALGILCAMNEGKLIDKLLYNIGTAMNCIPSFWISLIVILIFSVNLKLLPSGGVYDIGYEQSILNRFIHLILPLFVMVAGHICYYAFFVRNKLLEELKEDYVLLYKSMGFSNKEIVFKHCIRNIMSSYTTLMSMSLPHILTGAYIIEYIFSYPGLGSLSFESAKFHDYNLLMALCIITGVMVVLSSFICDILNKVIDPRMRNLEMSE